MPNEGLGKWVRDPVGMLELTAEFISYTAISLITIEMYKREKKMYEEHLAKTRLSKTSFVPKKNFEKVENYRQV